MSNLTHAVPRDIALISLASAAQRMSPHAYLMWLASEAARVAEECMKSGDWDDSASDASEAADALLIAVDCMYAASDSDRAERAAESAADWKAEDAREAA